MINASRAEHSSRGFLQGYGRSQRGLCRRSYCAGGALEDNRTIPPHKTPMPLSALTACVIQQLDEAGSVPYPTIFRSAFAHAELVGDRGSDLKSSDLR